MNHISKIFFSFILFPVIFLAQDSENISRLIQEFPFGRQAYAPLPNEFEIVPRINLWQSEKTLGLLYGFDMEYALSLNFSLEAGVSFINKDKEIPSFVNESGLELGVFYTLSTRSKFALTIGLESGINLEKEENEDSEFKIEPVIIAATSWGDFQLHGSINVEISSKEIQPGFSISTIYDFNYVRPFIELTRGNEKTKDLILTPGFVIPFSRELQLGLGSPLIIGNNSKMGITFYFAFEMGDED
jgi:hypothetical protein